MLFYDDGKRISSICRNYYVRIGEMRYTVEDSEVDSKHLINFLELKTPHCSEFELICTTQLDSHVLTKLLGTIRWCLEDDPDKANVDKRRLYPTIRSMIKRLEKLSEVMM